MNLNKHLLPKDRPVGGFFYERERITPLQFAANQGNMDQVQLLLELGADVNGPPGDHGSTLHYGLLSKDKDIVHFLLQKGANVDHSFDQSAIFKAVQNGLDKMIPALLAHGTNITATEDMESSLAAAFMAENRELMKFLWDKGARFTDEDGDIAVNAMEQDDYLDDMKLLLGDYDFDPTAKTSLRPMDLVVDLTVQKTDTQAIKLLIDRGLPLGGQEMQIGFEGACSTGHLEMVTFLLDNGAKVDLTKALSSATIMANNLPVVELLLMHGADVAADGGRSVHSAAGTNCRKTLARLLEQPMATEKRAEYLNQALQIAASNQDLGLCDWLLEEQGADINHCGPPYGSPLQAAMSHVTRWNKNRLLIIKKLLDKGAKVNPPLTDRRPLSKGPRGGCRIVRGESFTLAHHFHLPLSAAAGVIAFNHLPPI